MCTDIGSPKQYITLLGHKWWIVVAAGLSLGLFQHSEINSLNWKKKKKKNECQDRGHCSRGCVGTCNLNCKFAARNISNKGVTKLFSIGFKIFSNSCQNGSSIIHKKALFNYEITVVLQWENSWHIWGDDRQQVILSSTARISKISRQKRLVDSAFVSDIQFHIHEGSNMRHVLVVWVLSSWLRFVVVLQYFAPSSNGRSSSCM